MQIEFLLGFGSMGAIHKPCGERTAEFLARAARYNSTTEPAIEIRLAAGERVTFDRGDAGAYYLRDADAAAAKLAALRADQPAAQPMLHCKCCGQTGHRGDYPFSTLPGSGRCDDCV